MEVRRFEAPDTGSLETTPLIINGAMYVFRPRQKAIWLPDAETRVVAEDLGVTTQEVSRWKSA